MKSILTTTAVAAALVSASAFAEQPPMPDINAVFFQQFDADSDGRVSKSEFLAPTEAQFAHMDRNQDGALDTAEVEAFNQAMQQRIEEMRQRMLQQSGMPPRR